MDQSPPSAPSRRTMAVFSAAALIGGILAWGLVDSFAGHFGVSPEMAPLYLKLAGGGLTDEERVLMERAELSIARRNAALAFGLFGAVIAPLLGIAAGLAHRSVGWAVAAGLAGLCLGSLSGALGGLANVEVERALIEVGAVDKTYRTMAMHAAAWGVVAIGIALAAGLPARSLRLALRAAGMALVAGLVAALVYAPLAAIFFQMDNPELVVPEGRWNRLFWTTLAAGAMGVMIGSAFATRPRKDDRLA